MVAVFLSDERERVPRLAEHLASDFVYITPSAVVEGAQGLSDAYSRFRHEEWRQTTLRRATDIDMHHAHFRYAWERLDSGRTVAQGWCFGWVDAEGRISRIVSFNDPMPGRPL